MKCPKCGKDMELGGFLARRGDSWISWVPKSFVEKHWLNVSGYSKKSIEKEDGVIIKAYSNMAQEATTYCCRDCQLFVTDNK